MFDHPPPKDYLDHVTHGFCILIDSFATIFGAFLTGVTYVFGWPLALLSLLNDWRHDHV